MLFDCIFVGGFVIGVLSCSLLMQWLIQNSTLRQNRHALTNNIWMLEMNRFPLSQLV